MKLVILGPYPENGNSDTIKGGVQAVIVNMVKGLSRFNDLDIHIVTTSLHVDKTSDVIDNGVKVHTFPAEKKFGNIKLYTSTRKKLCRKINEIKPDLIHTHMLGYYTLAALESDCKNVIVSTHGLSVNVAPKFLNIRDYINNYTQRYLYRKCLEKTRHVIVNSPYARTRLSKLKDKTIYEVNNPISDEFFDIDTHSEEEERLLFVGYIIRRKGLRTLLKAIDILKEDFRKVRLMIAGQVLEKDLYSKLVQFIKDHGLEKSVYFLGSLNEDELKEQYKKASIFVFPSRQDVAPVAVLQAMAAGKAIVTTRVGGIPYIIDDGVNGFLVDKQDPSGLAEKIALFMKEPDLRRRLGLNAHTKVFENCRIDAVSRELYKIYNGMLS